MIMVAPIPPRAVTPAPARVITALVSFRLTDRLACASKASCGQTPREFRRARDTDSSLSGMAAE